MCDILTLAGVALSGASAVANASAASSAARARETALREERTRQAQLQNEANQLNTQSQDRYQGIKEKQDERATELGDYFNQPAPQAAAGGADANAAASVMPTSSNNIVLAESAKQNAAATAYAQKQGEALGNMRSFGDLLGGISREQARDAGAIGQVGGFMRGSSAILPYELEAAQQKGAEARMLGDVLGGAGSIATGAGLSGQGVMGFGAMKPGEAPRTFGSIYGRR